MRDDGVVYICNLTNVAENGSMPDMQLTRVSKYWFEMETIGINRQYLAKGADEQVDLLIGIAFDPNIRIGQYAVLGNGEQFRILTVQHFQDEMRRTQLSLERLNSNYAVND